MLRDGDRLVRLWHMLARRRLASDELRVLVPTADTSTFVSDAPTILLRQRRSPTRRFLFVGAVQVTCVNAGVDGQCCGCATQ